MCATDVDPNRLAAAQEAVRKFVTEQDDDTRIGLVLFSGFAQVAVSPTTDRDAVLQAIDTLTTGRGTTIGAAILKSLDAIAEINPDVPPVAADDPAATEPAAPAAPAAEIVVLLTDGANTRGITPEEAAQHAAARGVRIYPIGFGTLNPTTLVCTREQLGGTDPDMPRWGLGRSMGRDGRNFLRLDEQALRQVAETTDGAYFRASSADQLSGVLDRPAQAGGAPAAPGRAQRGPGRRRGRGAAGGGGTVGALEGVPVGGQRRRWQRPHQNRFRPATTAVRIRDPHTRQGSPARR